MRKRILVVGSGGAGKSTFSRALAARTGLPLIHLDAHYWRPGWIPTPNAEWDERVRELCNADSWIMDGNYSRTLASRIERCDAIVFFDIPRLVCLSGIVKRWFAHRSAPRPELPEGCPDKLDPAFVFWVWNYPRRSRPRIEAALRAADPGVQVFTVTSRAQTRELLHTA